MRSQKKESSFIKDRREKVGTESRNERKERRTENSQSRKRVKERRKQRTKG